MTQLSFADIERAGRYNFFRLPETKSGFEDCEIGLIGLPYDGGSTFRSGSRFAPDHLRRCSRNASHAFFDRDVGLRDLGNLVIPMQNQEAAHAAIRSGLGQIVSRGITPLSIGGDHSVTISALASIYDRTGPVVLVQFDAHPDTGRDADHILNPLHHGTVVRTVLERGYVRHGDVHQIGLRVVEDMDFCNDWGIHRWTMDAIERCGIETVLADVKMHADRQPVYVTFDIDVVDPAFAPGTGIQEPAGLTSREAVSLLSGLKGIRLAGFDLVEILPSHDVSDVTALLGVRLLIEAAALAAAG